MTRLFRGLSAITPALLLGACVSTPSEIPPASGKQQTSTAPSGQNTGTTQPANRPAQSGRTPSTIPPPPPPPSFENPSIMQLPGLEGVIGETAEQLTRSFGQPRLDVREGDARKLQFAGGPCVLDVYLYPTQRGATPTATHLEARRASDGFEVDRVACVNALRGR